MERRFQPVYVGEPTIEDTIEILKGLRDKYEAHHRVKMTDEALEAAARLSARYITDRYLPDKAIDLIDEAGARVRLSTMNPPDSIKELEKELEAVRKEKEAAVASQEFEKAAALRDKERQLSEQLEEQRKAWQAKKSQEEPVVDVDDIAAIISEWTGIPVVQLTEEEAQRLLRMEEEIHKRIINQEEAVSVVARAIRRARSGLKDPKRPIGSFLFLGPTGVGKTELARALAEFMFGDEDFMVRLDMSEFMERHEVAKLIGAPPGYIGYEEGGKLTEAVRRRPYAVVLLDEIEKAHPDVFNIFLQVLEDGRLTDGQGRVVDFRNTIIIMTSNLGAQDLMKGPAIGFSVDTESEMDFEAAKKSIMEAVRKTFRPEFLNRIDEIVIFKPLGKKELLQIIDLMIKEVADRLAEKGLIIDVTDEAKDFLLKQGYDPKFGARPLRRAIQRYLEDRLADILLEGKIKPDSVIKVDARDDDLIFIPVSGDEDRDLKKAGSKQIA